MFFMFYVEVNKHEDEGIDDSLGKYSLFLIKI